MVWQVASCWLVSNSPAWGSADIGHSLQGENSIIILEAARHVLTGKAEVQGQKW